MDLLLHQFTDIGIAGQEPEHFPRRRFPEHALGCQQRNRIVSEIETHSYAKHGAGPYAGAINTLIPLCPDLSHQVEILLLIMLSGNQATILQLLLRQR